MFTSQDETGFLRNTEMENHLQKAAVLVEALPYIRKYHGKTVVMKYGGSAMLSEEIKTHVMNDIILMYLVGMHPIIVHGGGPDIHQMLKKMEVPTKFVNGLRVTDPATMQVVEMVLFGKLNPEIANNLNIMGGHAISLSGKSSNLLFAKKKLTTVQGEDGRETPCDLGLVGEVESVNVLLLQSLIAQGYIPVISPIGIGENGETYNINADDVAGKVAAALSAEKLILLTDVEGVYSNYADKNTMISHMTLSEAQSLLDKKIIDGGMIPKIQCCIDAIHGGVSAAHILDGRQPHSIILELLTKEGIGTMIEG